MAVDRRMTSQEAVSQIKNGDTIAIGGWGPTRKPMGLVREIAKSSLKDLTVMCLGGLDADLLIGAGKVKKLVYPFMALEGAPGKLANFTRARADGSIEALELSENMFICGLKAAAERLPFYPTRSGLGTDILTLAPDIVTIEAPYTGEKMVAMPALNADVALIHANTASPEGYAQIFGDPLWDHVMVRTAKKVFVSAEKIITRGQMKKDLASIKISSPWVTGVIENPYGAHPGICFPNYTAPDGGHLNEYAKAAAELDAFKGYLDKYVHNVKDQAAYIELVGGLRVLAKLR